MLSRCLDQILTLPQKKSRLIRAIFLLSSFGGPLLTAASVSCCYRSGAVFCCCSPSASRFTIRDALLQNSVVTSCYLCSYLIKTVWLFSSDLNIFTQELTLFSIFLDRYRWSDGCVGKSHPEMLRPTTMPHLTSLHSPCFFILRIILNSSR